MAAFELRDANRQTPSEDDVQSTSEVLDQRRLREECIIALKVYDSCRGQDCLTPRDIGPARSAERVCIDGININEGDIINPPDEAAAVTIDKLRIKRVIIVSKKPYPFRDGYWEVELKFVFEYRLTFREADGSIICSIKAHSIYNKKVTLFGSTGSDLVLATDLLNGCGGDSTTLDSEPFILVESKAVALSAELKYSCKKRKHPCGHDDRDDRGDRDGMDIMSIDSSRPNEVLVTIGLFSIIKLYRIVNLNVESRGFCIPPECENISPLDPCEFFEKLDFPMDIFAPPQKPEFFAGVSSNIPADKNGDCGCD